MPDDNKRREAFGACSNHAECEAVCPKGIPLEFIAALNRDVIGAAFHRRREPLHVIAAPRHPAHEGVCEANSAPQVSMRLKTGWTLSLVRKAATSGDACYFLGTDSAPHPFARKVAISGVPGIFNAPVALPTYAKVFEEEGALDKLEAFASLNGPRHYKLPPNEERITLTREPWEVPAHYPFGADELVPLRAGESIAWRLAAAPGSRAS